MGEKGWGVEPGTPDPDEEGEVASFRGKAHEFLRKDPLPAVSSSGDH